MEGTFKLVGAHSRFTIAGACSGMVYAVGASLSDAAMHAVNNGFADTYRDVAAELTALAVGGAWKSHEDARGIRITRTA